MMICHDCEGEGVVEYEYTRSNNPDSPYGGLRTGYAVCETCGGSGEIEEDEDDWDWRNAGAHQARGADH